MLRYNVFSEILQRKLEFAHMASDTLDVLEDEVFVRVVLFVVLGELRELGSRVLRSHATGAQWAARLEAARRADEAHRHAEV